MGIREQIEALYNEARDGKNERYINEVLGSILARKIAVMISESTVPRKIYDSLHGNYRNFRCKAREEIALHKRTIERRNSEVNRMSKDICDLRDKVDRLER